LNYCGSCGSNATTGSARGPPRAHILISLSKKLKIRQAARNLLSAGVLVCPPPRRGKEEGWEAFFYLGVELAEADAGIGIPDTGDVKTPPGR